MEKTDPSKRKLTWLEIIAAGQERRRRRREQWMEWELSREPEPVDVDGEVLTRDEGWFYKPEEEVPGWMDF